MTFIMIKIRGHSICKISHVFSDGLKIGRLAGEHLSGWCYFQNFFFPGHRFIPDRDADKSRLSPEHVLRNITVMSKQFLNLKSIKLF